MSNSWKNNVYMLFDMFYFVSQKEMPKFMRNFTYILGDKVRGWFFPQIYYNYLDVTHSKWKVNLHAFRYIVIIY